MTDRRSDFRKSLGELIEERYPEPVEHPSAERWRSYLAGELAADEEEALQGHLVRCWICVELVQASAEFLRDADADAATGHDPSSATRSPPGGWWTGAPIRLAASLGVAVLALGVWVWLLQRPDPRRSPRPAGSTVDLYMSGDRADAGASNAAPGEDFRCRLWVEAEALQPYREFRVTLLDDSQTSIGETRVEPKWMDRPVGWVFELWQPGLEAGEYRYRLEGRTDGEPWAEMDALYALKIGSR